MKEKDGKYPLWVPLFLWAITCIPLVIIFIFGMK